MKVLIADDSPLVSQRLARMFGELDHVRIVGPAADGAEALRLFEEQHPAVAWKCLAKMGSKCWRRYGNRTRPAPS